MYLHIHICRYICKYLIRIFIYVFIYKYIRIHICIRFLFLDLEVYIRVFKNFSTLVYRMIGLLDLTSQDLLDRLYLAQPSLIFLPFIVILFCTFRVLSRSPCIVTLYYQLSSKSCYTFFLLICGSFTSETFVISILRDTTSSTLINKMSYHKCLIIP